MQEMSFFEHLGELRRRILVSLLAVLALSILLYSVSLPDWIIERVRADILGTLPLYAFTFSEAIMLKLKLSLVAGIVLCFPLLFYELWGFVAPGMTEKERRVAAVLLAPSILFFLLGVLFVYVVVLPPLISFLLGQAAGIAESRIQVTRAMEFVGLLMLLGGVIFQLPLVMAVLSRLRIAGWRFFARNAGYFLFLAIVSEIVLTDVSVLVQAIAALLLMVAYGVGLIASFLVAPR